MSKSTINREFLDKMYRRLHEAESSRANAKNPEDGMARDSLHATITRTIDDYLAAHAPAQQEAKDHP